MNRGVEIDGNIADDINRSVIQDQVEMGVAVRMAAMDLLAQNLRATRARARGHRMIEAIPANDHGAIYVLELNRPTPDGLADKTDAAMMAVFGRRW